MKSGVLGLIDGDFDELESFHRTREQDGTTFTHSLQVRRTTTLNGGQTLYYGEGAIQKIEETTSVTIDEESGDIAVTESPQRKSTYTEFVVVPNEFMAVGSGNGEFAFDLLREQVPSIDVTRAKLDLFSFAEDYYNAEEVDPWQVGFYGNIGQAEKGIVYGEDVFADGEIGDVLDRSQINQLGFTYPVDGERIKMRVAESGYVEIYQPSNYGEEEYADFLLSEIVPYASIE